MQTTPAVDGLSCTDCGTDYDPATQGRCPACGGALAVRYDVDAAEIDRETLSARRFDGISRYADLLPFSAETLVTAGEGATPLVACPDLAAELGVAEVYVKDEGHNPTGTTVDRQAAVAVAAAREQGAETVAHPTTGDSGQSVAAYAARAGLDSEAFVPARSTFVAKAMTNVHGGEMSVEQGRYDDVVDSFEDASADADWHSLRPFETPYRQEGAKTLLYEVVEQLDWTAPDAVVHPTGHGLGVVGSHRATADLRETGLVEETPALAAAQAEGCAPVVDAHDAGAASTAVWERPDTLIGALEVPDPEGGTLALDAVRETDGDAVAVTDDEALEGAVTAAAEGVEVSATGGVGVAAAQRLAEDGALGADDTVVLVNPVAGNKENDVLRSHLMRQGV